MRHFMLPLTCVGVAVAACLVAGWATGDGGTSRADLPADKTIQGIACAAGPAHLFAGGKLASCKLAQAMTVGKSLLPAGTWLYLHPDGIPKHAAMSRDAAIDGVTCRGNGPKGYDTAFHRNGRLRQCWLAADQVVQGVPCQGAGVLNDVVRGDPGVLFSDDGRFSSCRLSADFGGQARGSRYSRT